MYTVYDETTASKIEPECVPTWAEMRARLEEVGASDETMEAIRRATAGSRHAERVRRVVSDTLKEARAHLANDDLADLADDEIGELVVGGVRWSVSERERLVAALLLVLELHGAGGPGGLGGPGCATVRMPFARQWGKGRRHASDGAAWDAAAREALRGLARQADMGWARVPGVRSELGPVHNVGLNPDRVLGLARSRELVPQHFALATARASLLALLEAEDRPAVLDLGEGPLPLLVEVAGTAAEWAAVCTEIEGLPSAAE